MFMELRAVPHMPWCSRHPCSCHQSHSTTCWCFHLPHKACSRSIGRGMLPPYYKRHYIQCYRFLCSRVCQCRHTQDVVRHRWHSAERRRCCRTERLLAVDQNLGWLLSSCCRSTQGSLCLRGCGTCTLICGCLRQIVFTFETTASPLEQHPQGLPKTNARDHDPGTTMPLCCSVLWGPLRQVPRCPSRLAECQNLRRGGPEAANIAVGCCQPVQLHNQGGGWREATHTLGQHFFPSEPQSGSNAWHVVPITVC